MKLRKGSKYFVANPTDVKFGKRIPLTCHYRGLKPEGHLFTFVGDSTSGYWLKDSDIDKLVEPFTKEREAEVNAGDGVKHVMRALRRSTMWNTGIWELLCDECKKMIDSSLTPLPLRCVEIRAIRTRG